MINSTQLQSDLIDLLMGTITRMQDQMDILEAKIQKLEGNNKDEPNIKQPARPPPEIVKPIVYTIDDVYSGKVEQLRPGAPPHSRSDIIEPAICLPMHHHAANFATVNPPKPSIWSDWEH